MIAKLVSADFRNELAQVVGDANVRDVAFDGVAFDGIHPTFVVAPKDAEQVAAVLRFASDHNLVVVPHGGETMQSTGYTPDRVDVLLDTVRLNSVLHYDAGDLTLSVGAGMKVLEVQEILAAHGQFLPLNPPNPDRSTIGGTLAANVCGPQQVGYGSARDFCIGVEFVTGDGTIARGGGRVVKNVAGYDMMKLLIGSYGTLGVITSANFKVFPMPKQTKTFVLQFHDVAKMSEFLSNITRLPLSPIAMEVVSPLGMEYVSGSAKPRDPDHYMPISTVHVNVAWHVYLRAASSDAVLARYANDLGKEVKLTLQGDDEVALWRDLSDWPAKVAERHPHSMQIQLSFPKSYAAQVLQQAESSAVANNLLFTAAGRPTAGNMMAVLLPFTTDPASSMQYANAVSALRAELPNGCTVTALRCPKEAKERFDVWGTPKADLQLMREIRRTMDPKLILNRGRYIV